MIEHPGSVFVLSAPSGAGKSTLARRLIQHLDGLIFSVSYTTRAPRSGEVEGRDYHFVDDATFDRMEQEDGLLEWVRVYQHRYGTGRTWVAQQLAKGLDVLLDIETVGALNVKRAIPEAIMIFLLPPSAEELAKRLLGRGTESREQLESRMAHAFHEMSQMNNYDHFVINDDLDSAYRSLESIVLAERSRRHRMAFRADQILASFGNQA